MLQKNLQSSTAPKKQTNLYKSKGTFDMPPLKILRSSLSPLIAICLLSFSQHATATEFEIMPLVGYTFSPDLNNGENTNSIPTTDEQNFGLAFSWQDSAKGQGQILVNYVSRDFTNDVTQTTHSFDTLYAHFNGIAFFKEKSYTTTVGIGVGATYFDTDYDDAIYPSFTASLGTRYEFSDNLALITEIRAYATIAKDDDRTFCNEDTCLAQFDSGIWVDAQASIGIAYRF